MTNVMVCRPVRIRGEQRVKALLVLIIYHLFRRLA
jgi:hypothetical protein